MSTPPPDAMATLGTLIGEHERRDAVHVAVLPAVAGIHLAPGEPVGIVEGVARPCLAPIGIVDPFLDLHVQQGERFWLFLYPRSVTSLRHVWTHPAVPDEGAAASSSPAKVAAVAPEAPSAQPGATSPTGAIAGDAVPATKPIEDGDDGEDDDWSVCPTC